MRMDRLVVAGLALAATAGTILFAVGGFHGISSGVLSRLSDPARSGRGAWLLNPYCRNVPAPDFGRPPSVPRGGEFDAAAYGYAVTIPAGLTAYAGAEQSPQGFGIVLSWEPRAYLRVDAAYDVFYDITAAAVHRRDAGAVRLHDKLLTDLTVPDTLGGEAAERSHTQFQCPGDPQTYLHDDFIVIRNREVYRLELQTVPSRYEQDVEILAAIQRSWRWATAPARADR
jgi:hypothetical protein